MTKVDVKDLEDMPRRDLQALCKEAGIKANQKTSDLIEQLRNWIISTTNTTTSSATAERKRSNSTSSSARVSGGRKSSVGAAANAAAVVHEEVVTHVEEAAEANDAAADQSFDRLAAHKQERLSASKKKGKELREATKRKNSGKGLSVSEKFDRIHQRNFNKMKAIDAKKAAQQQQKSNTSAAAAAADEDEEEEHQHDDEKMVDVKPAQQPAPAPPARAGNTPARKSVALAVDPAPASSKKENVVTPWMMLLSSKTGTVPTGAGGSVEMAYSVAARTPSRNVAPTPGKTPGGLQSLTRPTVASARKSVSIQPTRLNLDASIVSTASSGESAGVVTRRASGASGSSVSEIAKATEGFSFDANGGQSTKKKRMAFADTDVAIKFDAPKTETTAARRTSKAHHPTSAAGAAAKHRVGAEPPRAYRPYCGKLPEYQLDVRSVFSSSTEKPTPMPRPTFDLKESLKRKLPYKTHIGEPLAAPVAEEKSTIGKRKASIAPSASAPIAHAHKRPALGGDVSMVGEDKENSVIVVPRFQKVIRPTAAAPIRPSRKSAEARKSLGPSSLGNKPSNTSVEARKQHAVVASKSKQQAVVAANRRVAAAAAAGAGTAGSEPLQLPIDLPVKYT